MYRCTIYTHYFKQNHSDINLSRSVMDFYCIERMGHKTELQFSVHDSKDGCQEIARRQQTPTGNTNQHELQPKIFTFHTAVIVSRAISVNISRSIIFLSRTV